MSTDDTIRLTLGDGTGLLRESRPLGQGGQGSVWGVRDRGDLAVKIYDRPPGDAQLRRLTAMLRTRPLAAERLSPGQPPLLVWPTGLVESDGLTVGYGMPRLPDTHTQLNGLLRKTVRLNRYPGQGHWKFLLGVAANLSFITAGLHDEGFVVGDLSGANAVTDGRGFITLLDCDSFAFTDARTGEEFDCDVFTDDYAAPERHEGRPADRYSDDFALAVLVYQLLTAGNHPFDGAPKQGSAESTRKDNIVSGTSFLVHPDRVLTPPQLLPVEVLPPAVAELARTAFGPGLREPSRRPTSTDWLEALDDAREKVARCTTVPDHYYSGHLSKCPWCQRRSEGRNDPYAPTADRGARSRSGSASASAAAPASASASASTSASASSAGGPAARSQPSGSAPRGASGGTAQGMPSGTSAGTPSGGAAATGGPKAGGAPPRTSPPRASGTQKTGTQKAGATARKPAGAAGGTDKPEELSNGCALAALVVVLALLGLVVWGVVALVQAVF